MVKRIIAILLSCALALSACGSSNVSSINSNVPSTEVDQPETSLNAIIDEDNASEWATNSKEEKIVETIKSELLEEEAPDFYGMNDPALLQYIEDTIYAELVDEFKSEDYVIDDVNAIFYSEDYLKEVAYNSKSNIFFGYTLEELEEQFQGDRFVFTLGDDGQTVVEPFEDYDDSYEKAIKNVAMGTGIILVCVTVSVISGGMGASVVNMVFTAAAKSGAIMASSSGVIGAVAAGTVTGIQTHDMDQALKAAAFEGSENFKWGAIIGSTIGGLSEAVQIKNVADAIEAANISEHRKAELRALLKYGGDEQVTYLAGKEVPYGTPGATRPDVIRTVGNHLEAIEVKYYNLERPANLNILYSELEREVAARVANLPANSTQRIVLDVTGRSFSAETVNSVAETIQSNLLSIYGSRIPVDIVGL